MPLEKMLSEITPYEHTLHRVLQPLQCEEDAQILGLNEKVIGRDDVFIADVLERAGYSAVDDQIYYQLTDTLGMVITDAFRIGNRSRDDLPIIIDLYKGKGGRVFSISHQGTGFDYDSAINAVRTSIQERGADAVNEEDYEQPYVMSILLLDDPGSSASYQDQGRAVHILIKNQPVYRLPKVIFSKP